MVEPVPAPVEISKRNLTFKERIAPIVDNVKARLKVAPAIITSRVLVKNELGTPLNVNPENAPSSSAIRILTAIPNYIRYGTAERTTPTVPLKEYARYTYSRAKDSLHRAIKPKDIIPPVPVPTELSAKRGINTFRYFTKAVGEALDMAQDAIRDVPGNISIGSSESTNEQLDRLNADTQSVRLHSYAGIILSGIVNRFTGRGEVEPTNSYDIDLGSGLIYDTASHEFRCTITELEERTRILQQSPRLIEQKQARVNERLLKRIYRNPNLNSTSRSRWSEQKTRQEDEVSLTSSGIVSGLSSEFNRVMGNPVSYFQEKKALELLGYSSPEDINRQRRPTESYNDTLQRLAKDRYTLNSADQLEIRKKIGNNLETDTQLLARLATEGVNGKVSTEDVLESYARNMRPETGLRILKKMLQPEGGGPIVLSEFVQNKPSGDKAERVMICKIAGALLKEIASGTILIDASGEELVRLAEIADETEVEVNASGPGGYDWRGMALTSNNYLKVAKYISTLSLSDKEQALNSLPSEIDGLVKITLFNHGFSY